MSTVSLVGTATTASSTSSLTPSVAGTWGTGQNRTAGDLLIALVTAYGNNTAFLGDSPAGWSLFDMSHGSLASGSDITAVYFKVAAGSDAVPTFTATMTGTAADCRLDVTLFEYSDSGGGTPVLSTSGVAQGTSAATISPVTGLNVVTGSAALAAITVSQGTTAATAAWTPPSGWTAGPNITASFRAQFACWTLASPSGGSTLTAALPHGRATTTLEAGIIVVIAPAGTAQPMYHDSLASKSQASVTAATGLTWTHVSNAAGALVVGISCGDQAISGTAAISTITCDGTALTAITALEEPGTGGDNAGFARQYGLANVSAGSHTIVVKPNQTVDLELSSRIIAGADTTSPFGTSAVAQGGSATASTTKTGTAGNLILYATCSGSAIGGGPNGPYRTYAKSLNGLSAGGAGDHGAIVADGSSQTISTRINSDDWAITVVEILPPSGGGSTSANAVLATGTGAAPGPVPAVGVNAALATGTGGAQSPVAAVAVNAAVASAAAAAQNATASTTASGTANAVLASGTGTAQSPAAAIGVNAGLATGTGAAQGVLAAAGVNAAAATGTGAAQSPAATTAASVTAVLATGTGTAQNATASTTASVAAVLASGTGAAQGPVPAAGVNAVLASAAGTAQNATASTTASGTANAVLASGTGAALNASATAVSAPAAALASGTGTARSPVPAIGVNAGLATGTGTAGQPSAVTAASVTAVLASGAGTALNATASTSSSGTANAVLASGAGAAQSPVPAIAVNAAVASGTGTAQAAGRAATAGLSTGTGAAQTAAAIVAAQAQAQAAHALAAALNATAAAVEPFTIGALTASDAPGAVLTAAGTTSALTASDAPLAALTAGATSGAATLTASDTRTGGPG